MITEDKVTEIYCMADDFCKVFDAQMEKYTIQPQNKRKYHRGSTLSKAEVMVIMILFHGAGYRCLKHFYLQHVCKHLRHLFPKVSPITALSNLSMRWPYLWPYLSRRYFWASARESALWTTHRFGYAATNVYTYTLHPVMLTTGSHWTTRHSWKCSMANLSVTKGISARNCFSVSLWTGYN